MIDLSKDENIYAAVDEGDLTIILGMARRDMEFHFGAYGVGTDGRYLTDREQRAVWGHLYWGRLKMVHQGNGVYKIKR